MKLEYIDQLIEKMETANLVELTYKDKEVDIKLKRESKVPQYQAQPVQPVQSVEAPAPPAPVASVPETSAPAADTSNIHTIKAPMVGTFYKSPSPEADPYVQVGDKIENDTIVCILEAMKLFNEIEAEVSGEIVEILVEDGEMVEYNQPLFKVK
ncbi:MULTISPECIES: acetyl-CoA carboxylase biotin carboxyl carrier protein [Nosocomiicoccus]|uniref:acetyl-CoA carboxylase biotin carboxyl carrier protein n=1 Tax=Nosocomiicoccus TaxID=489909 RepID=UPI0008A21486|nr:MULTISPECIES: acetyl-CoA carboxylase biotin carboxyl carrier protein [Nosocomiicoccus]MDK6862644.1 acetyl-CoA carboxylase biotin carboxyl carrier protein [Nosocomiicoccus ampullae]OFL47051.1 acetyl-CoA carboxylase, biotin carboxyl carrier protein [Nosocomiicoccus sp. HMSC067E10]OFO55486.1 acetyl-CoA carboxylase, biotin carboxyl carrier protein [Nosocomiicoccus sp. HMSC059G07]